MEDKTRLKLLRLGLRPLKDEHLTSIVRSRRPLLLNGEIVDRHTGSV